MFQSKSKNSSGKARVQHMKKNEIFCEEIREFIHESRKSQTIYSNFEGYHERTVKYNDLIKLDKLVFLTLNDGKARASLKPDEFAETDKLANLIVKKIYNSCTKFKCSEIRFQVVWIFYFDYLEKEMRAMPVFKVYKKNFGSEAFYIDISVSEYDSWDCFIMFSHFPVSFICIPRRGEYTFQNIDGGDLLDLEYICKNSQHQNKLKRNFRPFSQTVIQVVLHRVIPFGRVVTDFLNKMITFVDISGMSAHPTVAIFKGCITVLGIFFKIVELKCGGNESQNALESTAADCSLMLLNDNGENPSPWTICLSELYKVVEHPPRNMSWADVMNLMKNPQENHVEILKLVLEIIEVSKPLCVRVLGVSEEVLRDFLECLSELLSQVSGKNKIKGKISYSCEKDFSELCSRLNAGKKIHKAPADFTGLLENGLDLFGFRIYLLLKYTIANCKRFLQNFLKCNYTLEDNAFVQNITLNGNLIGIVIPFSFKLQNLAIVALRLDKLPEINN